jgi:hypothetical protein
MSQITITEVKTSELVEGIVRHGTRLVRKHYILSSMYAMGMLAVFLGTGLAVDYASGARYDQKMLHVSQVTSTELSRAFDMARRSDELYYRHKGWFSCDATCTKYYDESVKSRAKFEAIKAKRDSLLVDARREVGAWSVYGIADLRHEFWNAWEKGKEAAKRMTMFDAVFIGMGSMFGSNDRDNSFILTVIKILFQFIMNLSVGLFTSLVFFLFEAWSIIWSYGPSVFSALALFMLVFCAAGAVFVTTIGAATGALVGGVYLVAKSAAKNARLEGRHQATPARPNHLHWE